MCKCNPINKGGKRKEPTNYRTESLISVVAKLCESVIKDRYMEHLDELNVFTEHQIGFNEGRSCAMNLISLYSRATDMLQKRAGWVDCKS